MANPRTLFERILQPDVRTPRSSSERKTQMAESITRHLSRLLNSRQGCCRTLDDYGMPELENRAGSKLELGHDLEKAIRHTVSSYEPRLKRVQVRLDDTDEVRLSPKLQIAAELDCREDFTKDISFTTIITPEGKIAVE